MYPPVDINISILFLFKNKYDFIIDKINFIKNGMKLIILLFNFGTSICLILYFLLLM